MMLELRNGNDKKKGEGGEDHVWTKGWQEFINRNFSFKKRMSYFSAHFEPLEIKFCKLFTDNFKVEIFLLFIVYVVFLKCIMF